MRNPEVTDRDVLRLFLQTCPDFEENGELMTGGGRSFAFDKDGNIGVVWDHANRTVSSESGTSPILPEDAPSV